MKRAAILLVSLLLLAITAIGIYKDLPFEEDALYFGLTGYASMKGGYLAERILSTRLKKIGRVETNFNMLHLAAFTGNDELAKRSIERGECLNERDYEKMTPLHRAIERGNREIVDLLIRSGADVGARGKLGLTPMHIAAARGFGFAIRRLRSAGAEMNTLSIEGSTPLHRAILFRVSIPIIRLLLNCGSDPYIKDSRGRMAFDLAGDLGQNEIYVFLKTRCKNVRQLGR